MAGKTLIGALRVFLGLDTADFTEGVTSAKDSISEFVESVKVNLERLAAAFAVEKLVEGFLSINENLDALGKSAQKIGIPVEALQELGYAAQLADVPFDALQNSIAKFSKGLSEFQANGKGTVGAALKDIGVSATDANGKLKPQIQLIEEIADKFETYKDGANKTALAIALFGKAGADLIPLLNEGSRGIKEAGDQLLSFGGVATPEATKAAEKLMDNLTEIKAAFYSVAQQVVILVTPAVTKLTEAIVEFLGKGGGAKDAAEAIVAGLKDLAIIATQVYYTFVKFAETTSYWYDRLVNGTPYNKEAWDAFKASITDADNRMKGAISTIQNFQVSASKNGPGGAGGIRNSSQTLDAPAIAEVSSAQEKLNKLMEEGKRITEESASPKEAYNAQVEKLNELLAAGAITQGTYNEALDKAFTKYVNAEGALNKFTATSKDSLKEIQQYTDTVKNAFGDWFQSILEGSFNATDALKNLAIQLAKIAANNVLTGLFASLTRPSNALYGGGGGLLSGLLGFASGGTILAGGSGAIDSQVVAFRKSPDEQVDITKPGQRAASSAGVTLVYNMDNRGADSARVAALESTLTRQNESFYGNVVAVFRRERQANPGFGK